MTEFTEGFHTGEYLVSEANGYRSRDIATITGGDYQPGTVLGRITEGGVVTVTKTDVGGGKGAITLANPAYAAGAPEGDYNVIIIEPGSNAGTFEVEGPDGVVIGTGTVGTAFDGVVKFTLADGGTDFAAGDIAKIHVAIADPADLGKLTQLDPSATDGSQHAYAVLYDTAKAASADVQSTVHSRDCEVNDLCLTWPDGITDDQKATAVAELAERGIVVRT